MEKPLQLRLTIRLLHPSNNKQAASSIYGRCHHGEDPTTITTREIDEEEEEGAEVAAEEAAVTYGAVETTFPGRQAVLQSQQQQIRGQWAVKTLP